MPVFEHVGLADMTFFCTSDTCCIGSECVMIQLCNYLYNFDETASKSKSFPMWFSFILPSPYTSHIELVIKNVLGVISKLLDLKDNCGLFKTDVLLINVVIVFLLVMLTALASSVIEIQRNRLCAEQSISGRTVCENCSFYFIILFLQLGNLQAQTILSHLPLFRINPH